MSQTHVMTIPFTRIDPTSPRRDVPTVQILPTGVVRPHSVGVPKTASRLWRVVEHAGALLAHPQMQLGLLVLTEALVAAGGVSRPDAALARDAAEIVGSMAGARGKRRGGPRVVVE